MYEIFEKLLKERGLRVADVCKATGLSQSMMSDWKRGKYNPKSDKLQVLADFFQVPLETFTSQNKKRIVGVYHTEKPVERDGRNLLFNKEELIQSIMQGLDQTLPQGQPVYYEDEETAKLAQEMFEDKDMRALFHMKRGMEPQKFAAHMKMMKELYRLEHPEEFPEDIND